MWNGVIRHDSDKGSCFLVTCCVGLLASWTEATNEALAEEGGDGTAKATSFDAEVNEARKAADSAIGVEG